MGEQYLKVLLVDDSPLHLRSVRELLEDVPGLAVVHEAQTEQQARQWLQEHPEGWDLAIVDLFLQQGHGFNILKECRGRLPWQRVVVLSNYSVGPVREHVRDAGADAFFDKLRDMAALRDYCSAMPVMVQGFSACAPHGA
jgi:DNA-binding NarL/FixJ family response regulator